MVLNFKKYIAEFFGTMVLVLFACGTAVLSGSWISTALAFGLVIIAMAYSIGNISGCHINPAVSLAVFLSKKMSLIDFIGYVISQFLGGIVGTGLLAAFTRQVDNLGGNEITQALKNSGDLDVWSFIGAFLAEIVLTFVFVLVIMYVTDEDFAHKNLTGVIIGLTLTLIHLLGIGITGTSVNPARSFGPAIFQAFDGNTDSLAQIWIWILAPLAGAALAAFAYMFFKKMKDNVKVQ